MGRRARFRPQHLGGKLQRIRELLNLNQEQMTALLSVPNGDRSYLSRWERNELEPDLRVLLRYSEIANIYLEALVDDRLELASTTQLPYELKNQGIYRRGGNDESGE